MYSCEQLFFLQWSLTKNLGNHLFRQFIDAGFSFDEKGIKAFIGENNKISTEWRNASRKKMEVADFVLAEKYHIVAYCDDHYPSLLKEIPDPPPILYVRGDTHALKKQAIAVVGTRTPTPIGQKSTRSLVNDLVQLDFVVCSGLALGIDGCAHQSTLDCEGITIAVLGTGIDKIYPKRHLELAERIVEKGGILISEMPFGSPPLPRNFPPRNRIISGICSVTIVVEAAMKSGSLLTARQAIEQGREVFAFPGSIHSEVSRGCHWLIQQGANLFMSVDDIVEQGGCILASQNLPSSLDEECNDKLLKHMGFDVWHIDDLVESIEMDLYKLQSVLIAHEMKGNVKSIYGIKWQRII